jgi:formylmethanofuran dehydrogenase subunit C
MTTTAQPPLGAATILRLKAPSTLPIEADSIAPDRFVGLGQSEVAALPALCGRRWLTLGDLFTVEGEGSEDIVVEGDLSHIKRIGQGMACGRMHIHGNVGLHLGRQMSGGEIVVQGDVDAWAGAQMSGGMIRVY